MAIREPEHEVFALRYGTKMVPRSHNYYRFFTYGEDDVMERMDFFFWVIRAAGDVILVDTGFTRAAGDRRGHTTVNAPVDALRRLGIEPEDVAHVVLSHLHYDHVGNIGAYPNATFSAARRELDFWAGPYGTRKQFASAIEVGETEAVLDLERSGRLVAFDEGDDVRPGISVITVGGHTPGQAVVTVRTPGGHAVLASDALHYYEELELDRPGAYVSDLADTYRAFDRLSEFAARPGYSIVAGHDPKVLTTFAPIDASEPGRGVRIP